jgi:cyclopropane fatty-acyl-phospholipid synthase-like methyltransferase
VFQHLPRDVVQAYFTHAFAKLVNGGKLAFQMMVDDSETRPEPPASHPYGLRYYTRGGVGDQLKAVGFDEVRAVNFETAEPDPSGDVVNILFVATRAAA